MKMKKVITSICFVILSTLAFSQSATIDGIVCGSATSCPKYVCENSTVVITAGISPGTIAIDSVKWLERISTDGGNNYGSWTQIGNSLNKTIPTVPATIGNAYQYWLVVYPHGYQPKSAYAVTYVYAMPTAMLLSNDTTICQGTSATFTASAGGTNYDFKVGTTSVQSGALSSFTTNSLMNNDTVTVTITNGNGCQKTSAPIIMTVYPTPKATTVTGNPIAECVGINNSVTVTGLLGTGPWQLEVWNTTGGVPSSLRYSVPGSISNPNTVINVPTPSMGTNNMFLRVIDSHMCSNH